MKFTEWKEIAELIGTAALIASLIFVGMQMQQSQAIAMAESNASYIANRMEESALIIDNIEVWLRGNAGESLTDQEQEIYGQLLRNVNDGWYFAIEQQKLLDRDALIKLDVAAFAAFLRENPGAERVWRAREDWLARNRAIVASGEEVTSDWVELIETGIAELDRQPPDEKTEP